MLVNLNNLMWPSAPHHFTELRPYSKFTSKLGKFTNCLLISHKNRQQQHEKLLVNVTATTDDHFPTESHLHAETVCVCVCVYYRYTHSYPQWFAFIVFFKVFFLKCSLPQPNWATANICSKVAAFFIMFIVSARIWNKFKEKCINLQGMSVCGNCKLMSVLCCVLLCCVVLRLCVV